MYARARHRYQEESVYSASPAKRFLMLFDRLIVDLDAAHTCFEESDLFGVHTALRHGQDIVHLMMVSLRDDIWEGARNLYQLYGYALNELIQANLLKDRERLKNAELVLRPLHATWHEAARLLEADGTEIHGVA
jgi:flagellar protein FliS